MEKYPYSICVGVGVDDMMSQSEEKLFRYAKRWGENVRKHEKSFPKLTQTHLPSPFYWMDFIILNENVFDFPIGSGFDDVNGKLSVEQDNVEIMKLIKRQTNFSICRGVPTF